MMPFRSSTNLSRRLLSNYLLFGLLSIAALGAGIWFLLVASADAQVGQNLLSRLSSAAEAIAEDYSTNDGRKVQQLIDELAVSDDVLFCAIMSNTGQYISHSNHELVGRNAARPIPAAAAPGVIERISYLREDHTGPREYWLPLRSDSETHGMLQAGVPGDTAPDWNGVLRQHAPTAVMLPILLLLLGGGKLIRVVKSTAAIERQLAGLGSSASEAPVQLRSVEASNPAAFGWNRLVAQCGHQQILASLETRLSDVMGGFRADKSERILQSLTDGVAVTNEDGHVTFANRAFSVLLKTDPGAANASLEDILLAELPGNEDRFRTQLHEPSRPGVAELHRSGALADGVLRLARFPLRSEDGQTLNHVWSLRDVTQQKLVERTRDQFVDTATHELRTPLGNIIACAETLQQQSTLDGERAKQYLNVINMEATRLGRFVDDFLNISRMEAGSLSLNRFATDFERMVSEVVGKLRPQLDQKHIEFQALLPPKIPEVTLDKDKIAAALVNLLGNAVKYTPEGGRVSLQVELVKDGLRIHVEDSGFGIAAEDLPHVFNKFFRSEDPRVCEINGTGLGLSFAQEVVRLHGGKITVKSQLNEGSRFTLTLPLSCRGRHV